MRKLTPGRLLFATHNAGKLDEMKGLLGPKGFELVRAADFDLPEPIEDGTTFVENARIKAHAAAKATGLIALSDDSGIEIDGLGGQPGVYTADWAETPSGRDFVMAMNKAHDMLVERNIPKPWTARFCCTLVLAWPNGEDEVFEGKVEGHLTWPMRGTQGHGYDPCFLPNGYNITFAEMESAEKNKISHRSEALAKFAAALL